MSLTKRGLLTIIEEIKYKDWKFNVDERADCFTLKITFMAPDLHSGKEELQHCRKWFISKHACRAEIVRTAYKAVVAAETHEVDENFQFRDVRVYSPHTDPDDVVDVQKRGLVGRNKRVERQSETV